MAEDFDLINEFLSSSKPTWDLLLDSIFAMADRPKMGLEPGLQERFLGKFATDFQALLPRPGETELQPEFYTVLQAAPLALAGMRPNITSSLIRAFDSCLCSHFETILAKESNGYDTWEMLSSLAVNIDEFYTYLGEWQRGVRVEYVAARLCLLEYLMLPCVEVRRPWFDPEAVLIRHLRRMKYLMANRILDLIDVPVALFETEKSPHFADQRVALKHAQCWKLFRAAMPEISEMLIRLRTAQREDDGEFLRRSLRQDA